MMMMLMLMLQLRVSLLPSPDQRSQQWLRTGSRCFRHHRSQTTPRVLVPRGSRGCLLPLCVTKLLLMVMVMMTTLKKKVRARAQRSECALAQSVPTGGPLPRWVPM